MFSSILFEFVRLFASLGTFKHAAAIAGLTIVAKIAFSPLTLQRIRTQIRITSLKPELDRLKKKHAGDPKRLMVERGDVMRREGLGASKTLLPNLVQMPVMIGMYQAIRVQARWAARCCLVHDAARLGALGRNRDRAGRRGAAALCLLGTTAAEARSPPARAAHVAVRRPACGSRAVLGDGRRGRPWAADGRPPQDEASPRMRSPTTGGPDPRRPRHLSYGTASVSRRPCAVRRPRRRWSPTASADPSITSRTSPAVRACSRAS